MQKINNKTLGMCDLKLGLIGDHITQSKSPMLHKIAGAQNDLEVQYDRLIPKEAHSNFDDVFYKCEKTGYRGLNITYPYKEQIVEKLSATDPMAMAIGAVNTVIFHDGKSYGYNTDYSGFIASYKNIMGAVNPGKVCMIGAGGVGRAIAFGLITLGVDEIRLVDLNVSKAESLKCAINAVRPDIKVEVFSAVDEAALEVDGLINSTPIGMKDHEGTPLPSPMMKGARWAFDAVYTPINTQFLTDAKDNGLQVISGYELFFYQAIDSWKLFSGRSLDELNLRNSLNLAITE